MGHKTRAVVYLDPDQHAKIAAIQRELGLSSVAEAHRLAIDAFDPDRDSADLDALVEVLARSNKEVAAALDDTESEIRKTIRYFRELED